MNTTNKITVFLVDDDTLYLKLLEKELSEESSYLIRSFSTGEDCLKHLAENPDVIVLDYYLNGIKKDALNGVETLIKIKATHPQVTVIMLSAQDKIEVAINCMKLHAFEYIVKSETAVARLKSAISNMLHYRKMETTLSWYMNQL